jgi:hypothetical protein
MSDIRQEMDQVINELESKGINFDTTRQDLQTRGLGDVVEGTFKNLVLLKNVTKNGLDYKNVIVLNVKNI